jgi:hypothetical protein
MAQRGYYSDDLRVMSGSLQLWGPQQLCPPAQLIRASDALLICSPTLSAEIARVAESTPYFESDALSLDPVLSRQSSYGAAYPSPGTPRTPDSPPLSWPAMSPEVGWTETAVCLGRWVGAHVLRLF